MANCSMCGISIPDGQRTCSMCYGDVDHGRDGYYRRWMERAAEQEEARRDEVDDLPEKKEIRIKESEVK